MFPSGVCFEIGQLLPCFQGIIGFIKLIIPRLSKPFGLCSLLYTECPRDEDSMVMGKEGYPGARKAVEGRICEIDNP